MNIVIGSDHAGFECKEMLQAFLTKKGYTVIDLGPENGDSVDYPDYAHKVAKLVEANDQNLGILICGSGNGVCITANKHAGIRAALCWNVALGILARSHNNANILCLPARFISKRMAKNIVTSFLSTEFEGGRHQTRVNKIPCN